MATKQLVDLDFNSVAKGINHPTPSADGDLANKSYVDNVALGLDIKASVKCATTADGTLATAFDNASTIDGITLTTGDRILIKNQTASEVNGIYVVAASGAPVRATDTNSWAELVGAFVFVEEGTLNADKGFVCTVNTGGTLESTAVTWTQFSDSVAITAGAGMTETSSAFNVIALDGSITVAADSVTVGLVPVTKGGTGQVTAVLARGTSGVGAQAVAPATGTGVSAVAALGIPLKVSATIGDGSNANITVTHNLGTSEVVTQVRQAADDVVVNCEIDNATTNTVILRFAAAPATDALKVVIVG